MAPSAVAEHVILDSVLASQKVEILPVEQRAMKPQVVRSIKPAFEFSKAVLVEQNPMRTGSKALDVTIAVMLHAVVIATLHGHHQHQAVRIDAARCAAATTAACGDRDD